MPSTKAVQQKQDVHSPRYPASRTNFDRLLLGYLKTRSHETIVSFFDRRAPYSTIKKWRQGKRNPPQWALDILTTKTAVWIAEIKRVMAGLEIEKKKARR